MAAVRRLEKDVGAEEENVRIHRRK
jgi:hypothetical protein